MISIRNFINIISFVAGIAVFAISFCGLPDSAQAPADTSDLFPITEGLVFSTIDDSPLDLAVHPLAQRYQYSLQILPDSSGKHIGIIASRDYASPAGDDKRRMFVSESSDLINWTNGRIALEPSDVGAYGSTHLLDPFVMVLNDRMYMWFAGIDNAGVVQIGCANSTDNFQTVEVTPSPVVPINFSGTGKDAPNLTDDFNGVYEEGRILFIYNGGVHNTNGLAGSIEGDPMDPASYKPLGEIYFDKYPTPDWYAGTNSVYRAKEGGYFMLRCVGMTGAQDIDLYTSDDFIQWHFKETLLKAGAQGSWNAVLYKPFLTKVGQEWQLSYSATEAPIFPSIVFPQPGPNEKFRCGLAIGEISITSH